MARLCVKSLLRAAAPAAALLLFALPRAAAAAPNADRVWLAVSDIHLDVTDRRSRPSLVGSDTNVALFESLVAEMKKDVPDPEVVLLPGDFFVHDLPGVAARNAHRSPEAVALQTMAFVAEAFDRTYPHARFAIALGNNDVPCGDYRVAPGSTYLSKVARIWEPLVDRNGAAPGFERSFGSDGYYVMPLPRARLRMIALDTVRFSTEYRGQCAGSGSAGDELDWLASTLRATPPGTRNLVMMHVPPGYDAFSTEALLGVAPGHAEASEEIRAKLGSIAAAFAPWPFLRPWDNARLVDALETPENRVAWAIAGHAHRFDFRVAGATAIVVLGSVSPVYHNNPAFYKLLVGDDGSLRDVDTYAYDEWSQSWMPPYGFDAVWNVAGIDAAALSAIHERLGRDPALRERWDAASSARPSNASIAWNTWGARWRIPWCAQTIVAGDMAQCAGISPQVTRARLLIGGAGGLALLAVAAAVTWGIVWAKRRSAIKRLASGRGRV